MINAKTQKRMKGKSAKIILVTGFWLLVTMCAAHAATHATTGNPLDTEVGTVITAEGYDNILNYTDINDNLKPEVISSTIEVTVLPVYGFSFAGLPDIYLYVNEAIQNTTYVTNEGNASGTYEVTFNCDFDNDGPGTWTVTVYTYPGNVLIGTLTPGSPSVSTTTEAVGEDGQWGFYHSVEVPSDGDSGDYIVITTTVETTYTPTGEYTGANGLTYGGLGYETDPATYTIIKPVLTLTRVSTVDAPKAAVGYAGEIHDAVPGSIITYTLSYDNTGNHSARNVILIDRVPTYESGVLTNLAHFNHTGDTTNVDITPIQGTAPSWIISYSTLVSPNTDYDNTGDWTLLGTLVTPTSFPASSTYISGDATWEATWVKWERPTVPSTESGTLTWGVTIR